MIKEKLVFKGDIWHVNLGLPEGSEQGGNRPCLVMQNDIGNEHSSTTIVCPITTKNKKYDFTHVRIDCLNEVSYIMCEQLRAVNKDRLKRLICRVEKETLLEVGEKIKLHLEI